MQQLLNSMNSKMSNYLVKELKNEVCQHETRKACFSKTGKKSCNLKHYYKLILPFTKELLGLCLKEFFNPICEMNKCEYIHFT